MHARFIRGPLKLAFHLLLPLLFPAHAVEIWQEPTLPGRHVLIQPAASLPGDRPAAVLFHLPPTSGNPAVDDPLPGIVQVGMPALSQEEAKNSPDLATATWRSCHRILARLQREHPQPVNPNRCLVSGFSRGGWIASNIGMKQAPELIGLMIFGAGHLPDAPTAGQPFRRHFKVYIASGDLDENFPLALHAMRLYREMGVPVSLERYPLAGHTRRMTPRAMRWLAEVASTPPAPGFLTDKRAAIAALPNPWLRTRLLEHGLRDPAMASAPPGEQAAWQEAFRELTKNEVAREGARRRQTFRTLLNQEVRLHAESQSTPAKLEGLKQKYQALAKQHPKTPEAVEAKISILRLGGIIKRRVEEQRRFMTHPAAAKLRKLQEQLNAVQARITASGSSPKPADLREIRDVAESFKVEAAQVRRAGEFLAIKPAVDLGPPPLPPEADAWLKDPAIAPAEALFPDLGKHKAK